MNWSLSKLGTFTKCRRRFLYSYIQNLKGTPQPFGASDRGVAQHKIIETYFAKEIETLPPDLMRYQAWFDMLRGYEYYAENKLAMLEGWLPTYWEDEKAWWKGVLDLKVLNGNGAWVFDWKTGKVYPDHIDQKELYSIATFIAHSNVEMVEAWHVYLDLIGKDTKKIYQRKDLDWLIPKWNAKLAPYMQALDRYKPEEAETFFVTNPSYLCDYCPFSKNPCPH
jgi:PD-(D/E)XK nuclease superfamily